MAAQRMVRAPGNSTPLTMSWLNELRRAQVPLAGVEPGEFRGHAVRLMGGHDDGAALADGHLRLADIPTDVLRAGHASSRSPPSRMRPQAVPVPFIRP